MGVGLFCPLLTRVIKNIKINNSLRYLSLFYENNSYLCIAKAKATHKNLMLMQHKGISFPEILFL